MVNCVFSQSIKNIIYYYSHVLPIDAAIFQRKIDTINRSKDRKSGTLQNIKSRARHFVQQYKCFESCNSRKYNFPILEKKNLRFVHKPIKKAPHRGKMASISWAMAEKNCPNRMALITNGNGVNLNVIETWIKEKRTPKIINYVRCV